MVLISKIYIFRQKIIALVYDFDGSSFVIHDPGRPPLKSRKVGIKEFEKCFNYPGGNPAIGAYKKNNS